MLDAPIAGAPAVITGSRLFEADFSGIEAVLTGWFMEDPSSYIRLAKLGVHAYLTTNLIHEPADLRWSDDDLAACFKLTKKNHPGPYDKAKRNVHGNNYGLTPYGMVLQFPETFATLKEAEHVQAIYHAIAPKLPAWQKRTQKTAHELHYLGGSHARTLRDGTPAQLHPFGYKHWFWSVFAFEPITPAKARSYAEAKRAGRTNVPEVLILNRRPYRIKLGDDAKRAVAFYPQSTAAAILYEAMLQLFNPVLPTYIGDAYYGRTPLRAPIHDSLLMEIPVRQWDRVVSTTLSVMTAMIPQLPIPAAWRVQVPTLGPFVSIGVEAKWSASSWGEMDDLDLSDYVDVWTPPAAQVDALPIVQDGWMPPSLEDADDEDERSDLAREMVL